MNEVIRSLQERKSTRAFEQRGISPEDKQTILLAAMAAPSPGNQQLYTILDITDQPLKDTLAVTCDNQPFIATAPMVLVFIADCQKWYDAYEYAELAPHKPGPGDIFHSIVDASIAAQNAVIAATSLGIGSCYIGDILERCEIHRPLFNLPRFAMPACMVVFGYPTEVQRNRQKPERCALKHIVHENGYRYMNAEELREMLQKKTGGRPYEEWIAAFYNRKYASDFAAEMNRSVAEYCKEFTFKG
ncbi:MAG: nitroreductase family protein [Clostridiaceae bacterium]